MFTTKKKILSITCLRNLLITFFIIHLDWQQLPEFYFGCVALFFHFFSISSFRSQRDGNYDNHCSIKKGVKANNKILKLTGNILYKIS